MPAASPPPASAAPARRLAPRIAQRAALVYLVLAGLWVLLSDELLAQLTDRQTVQQLGTAKGLAFVLVSAVALYFLIEGLPTAAWSARTPKDALQPGRPQPAWRPWLVLTSVTCAVLAVAALDYHDRRETLRQESFDAIRAVARMTRDDLADWVEERRRNAIGVAGSALVRRPLETAGTDQRSLDLLRSGLATVRHAYGYRTIEVWDPKGRRVVSDDPALPQTPEILQAARRAVATGQEALVDFHLDSQGRTRLAMVAPVHAGGTPEDTRLGVVVFEIDAAQQLYPRLRDWPLASTTGELLIVRRDGQEALYLSPLRDRPDAAMHLRRPLDSPELKAAFSGTAGGAGVQARDHRGVEVLASALPLPGVGWVVEAKVDRDQAMAPLNRDLLAHLLFIVVGTASALMLAGLMRQRDRVTSAEREVAQSHALQAAEERFRATFEQAAIGLCHVDAHGRLLRANALCLQLLGLGGEGMESSRLQDLLQLGEAELASLNSVLLGARASFSAEVRGRWGDQLRGWLHLTVSGVHADDGSTTYSMVVLEDIGVRKMASQALARSEARMRSYAQNAPVGMVALDMRGRLLEANPAMLKLWGRTPTQRWMRPLADLTDERGRPLSRFASRPLLRGSAWHFEAQLVMPDDSTKWVSVSAARVDETSCIAFVQDVTARKREERAQLLSLALFRHTQEGLVITDPRGDIVSVNPAYCRISGYSEHELVGCNPRVFSSGRHDRAFYQQFWQQLKEHGFWQGEIWNRRKSGEVYPEWLIVNAVHGPDGRLQNYVAACMDITRNKASEQELERLAHHDALTGLGNRMLFVTTLEKAVQRARRDHTQGAVLMLDLDRFKTINESLGHPVGDLLLQEVAKRLGSRLRQADSVARLGGDEFAVLLEDIGTAQHAGHVAQLLIEACSTPFTTPDGQEVYVGASVGISVFPGDSDRADELLQQSDAALYGAKDAGRGTFRFFTGAYTREAQSRLDLESGLRRALDENQLEVHYQPLVKADDGVVKGVEALVRWRHPERGLVSPGTFIPLAEETGLIVPLGEWVLRTACGQVQQWSERGLDVGVLAVNLSPRQFQQAHLVEQVASALHDSGLDASRLELEITEGALMDAADAGARLKRLKALGLRLAIDDFGTGYSSLAYLSRFPLDKLKIDQSFVRRVPDDAKDVEIVSAVISLARSLKLRVLAEGVETEAQHAFLRDRGCDFLQGYLFARPMPAADLEELLRTQQQALAIS